MTKKRLSTRLIQNHSGGRLAPGVNPPIERASTLMMDSRAALYGKPPTYGRMGHAVHRELEAALCDLEGGEAAHLTPNGLSACTLAIAACVKAGDHVLITDNVYGPTRRFCQKRLKEMGVEAEFFDPRIGSDIDTLIREDTSVIFFETPGSLTFELTDLPAISAIAKPRGISLIADNTWGAGVFYRPIEHGADISVQALTKYVVGHADAFGGAIISANARHAQRVKACTEQWGIALAPDDAYFALRGLRTLHTRLSAHQESALAIATWLQETPEVKAVLHPALPEHPDHDLWKRDYSGACGLFSIVLEPMGDDALDVFLSGFDVFGFGFSWGGFESLLNPADGEFRRTQGPWASDTPPGRLIRLHIGLEHPEDLKADLADAFARLRTHQST